jgi:hypothetical protein
MLVINNVFHGKIYFNAQAVKYVCEVSLIIYIHEKRKLDGGLKGARNELIMLSLCMQKEERENLFLRKVQISIFT